MRQAIASAMACAGCGYQAPPDEPFPLRCSRAGDGRGADHVMVARLLPEGMRFPDSDHPNPFIRYRTLLHTYHLAIALGATDAQYVDVVERLDAAVARVDGRGFAVTPFGRSGPLSVRLGFSSQGSGWVKDETGNVAGSHKARHLMGLTVHLTLMEEIGLPWPGTRDPVLAIASCGNAALAAAVVARAAGRRLDVFVPTWADPDLLTRLRDLQARVIVCPRKAGVPGDPTYRRLQQAIGDGAFPFTCQGPLNGLTIEGGKTLGYEMVSALAHAGADLDRLLIQVGGGALASACIQAFRDAVTLGVLRRLPRIHAVQTRAVHPLKRAYDRVRTRVLDALARHHGFRLRAGRGDRDQADLIASHSAAPAVQDELRYAAAHRAEFMWPWDEEPRSVASGIIDDETYDWLAVVRGMVETGGYPVVVDEATVIEANRLVGRETGIPVSPTGSAGLAGLLALRRAGEVEANERVAIVLAGMYGLPPTQ